MRTMLQIILLFTLMDVLVIASANFKQLLKIAM